MLASIRSIIASARESLIDWSDARSLIAQEVKERLHSAIDTWKRRRRAARVRRAWASDMEAGQ